MSLGSFSQWPFAAVLWLSTLCLVAAAIAATIYICTQRMLLTGKLLHAEMGRRLWQAIWPPQVFAALCIATVLWYEWARVQAGDNSATSSTAVAACRSVFWLSHLTPSFYALPYIQRGLRMVVLFDTGLRKRYRMLTSVW